MRKCMRRNKFKLNTVNEFTCRVGKAFRLKEGKRKPKCIASERRLEGAYGILIEATYGA